jgi:hypothetical protein
MVNQCLVVRSQANQPHKRYDNYLVILTSIKQASMSGQRSLTFAGMTQFDKQEAAMELPGVVFMGSTIFPIVAPIPSGFSSMVIIVDGNQGQRGSGTLGTFETRDDAFKCAIEHAKAEIRRHCLMTIIC